MRRYMSAVAVSARTVYGRKTSYILCRSSDHHMNYNYYLCSYGYLVDKICIVFN